MSSQVEWYPWFLNRYAASRRARLLRTGEEHGVYRALLDEQWRDGVLPDSPEELAGILPFEVSPNVVRHVLETCFERCDADALQTHAGAFWVEPVLEEIRQEQGEKYAKKSRMARKAAIARWNKATGKTKRHKGSMQTHSGRYADAMQTHSKRYADAMHDHAKEKESSTAVTPVVTPKASMSGESPERGVSNSDVPDHEFLVSANPDRIGYPDNLNLGDIAKYLDQLPNSPYHGKRLESARQKARLALLQAPRFPDGRLDLTACIEIHHEVARILGLDFA